MSGPMPTALTALRKSSAPYLPPPLLRFLHVADTYVKLNHASFSEGHCHDEPSMAVLAALFLAYVVCRSVQGMWASTTSRSTAHLTGEEDAVLGGLGKDGILANKKGGDSTAGGRPPPPFEETVVLCGASNAGKTALLHRLCHAKDKENAWDPPMTVTSLVANVGYVCPWEDANDASNGGNMTIRIIDYPGHPSLSSQLTSLLLPSVASRLVFVLDATQPVAVGAALLYQYILTHAEVREAWQAVGKTLEVLVVCTKNDVKGAKNYKRMKIQLRNELDKLRKVDLAVNGSSISNGGGVNGSSNIMLNVKGKMIDLDNLGADVLVSLHFVESGFGVNGAKGGMAAINDFVVNGVLPNPK